jgi:hypothetical protein
MNNEAKNNIKISCHKFKSGSTRNNIKLGFYLE